MLGKALESETLYREKKLFDVLEKLLLSSEKQSIQSNNQVSQYRPYVEPVPTDVTDPGKSGRKANH